MAKNGEVKPPQRIGIFGLGRFGFGLAVRLAELGADVLAVDSDAAEVEEIDQRVSKAICLDATNEFAVKKAGISELHLAIVCIGRNIQSSLLTTAVLRKAGASDIWVRAIDQSQAEILEAMGVTKIMSLEKEMALQVAQSIMMPGAHMIAPITANHSLAEVAAKPDLVGKTLKELDFRAAYGVNIVAIKTKETVEDANGSHRVEARVDDLPGADTVIRKGDVLVVIGADDKVLALQANY